MVFQILPRYKLRQLGESIQYNDQIFIENTRLKCKINSSTEVIEIDKEFKNNTFKNPYKRIDLRKNDFQTPRYSTFLSNFTSIKLFIYYPIFSFNI